MSDNEAANESFSSEIFHAASRIKFPGMCFIISDFLLPLNEIFESVNILRAKNLDVTLICVRDKLDEDPYSDGKDGILVDGETNIEAHYEWGDEEERKVKNEILKHDGAIQKYAREAQISFIAYKTESDISQFILETLVKSNVIR